MTQDFVNYFNQACMRTFPLHKVTNKSSNKPDWFDAELAAKRKQLSLVDRNFSNVRQKELVQNLCKEYRAEKQRKTRQFNSKCVSELEAAYNSNQSNVWPLLSKFSKQRSADNGPTGEEFIAHYRELSKEPVDKTFDDVFEKEVIDFLEKYDNKQIGPPTSNNIELEILNNDRDNRRGGTICHRLS